MKRAAMAAVLTGATWMGLSGNAHAQALIMPTGPLLIRTLDGTVVSDFHGLTSKDDKFYPGRTMGGGPRILRANPPPSSLKRRKE